MEQIFDWQSPKYSQKFEIILYEFITLQSFRSFRKTSVLKLSNFIKDTKKSKKPTSQFMYISYSTIILKLCDSNLSQDRSKLTSIKA